MRETNEYFIKNEKEFGLRLAKLREALGISAREMSFDLGQNKNYINSIESGKSYPSMAAFIYICDYMKITPKDFFDPNFRNPTEPETYESVFRQLPPEKAFHIHQLAMDMLDVEK